MEIRFYTLPSGGCPVEDYLDGLDARARDKTLRSIMLLREYGALLREPDSKHLRTASSSCARRSAGMRGGCCTSSAMAVRRC